MDIKTGLCVYPGCTILRQSNNQWLFYGVVIACTCIVRSSFDFVSCIGCGCLRSWWTCQTGWYLQMWRGFSSRLYVCGRKKGSYYLLVILFSSNILFVFQMVPTAESDMTAEVKAGISRVYRDSNVW